MTSWGERRAAIFETLEAGDVPGALEALVGELETDPGPRVYALGAQIADRLGAAPPTDIAAIRLKVLRSFTVEPAAPALRAWALAHRLAVAVDVRGYDQIEQEILGPRPDEEPEPDAVLVATRLGDLAPPLARGFAALAPDAIDEAIDAAARRVAGWLSGLRRRHPRARLLVTGMVRPRRPAFGLADPLLERGHRRAVEDLDRRLAAACRATPGATLVDVDASLAEVGLAAALDPRMEAHARQPLSAAGIDALARHLARVLAAAFTPRRKCVVLDCDNTLWGGVVGEDGPEGIALGPDYPGSAFVAMQRALLDLARRGVVLAIASKNNEADVLEVLEHHPHQVLRARDFAAWRINWGDKVTALRELAAEINIGLDSLVFLDDSEFELALVAERLPEVEVVRVPSDPLALEPLVRSIASLDALAISDEDRRRGAMYRAQAARSRARAEVESLETFLESLELRLRIEATAAAGIERAAQLCRRTNQLNLTTRRHAAADIEAFIADPDRDVFHVRLADRFGDYGVCGLAVLDRSDPARAEIDTLLLSCRVIGRGVEEALVAFLARRARRCGAAELVGLFVPSRRNQLVADLYDRLGFDRSGERGDAVAYRLDLGGDLRPYPAWFTLDVPDERSE